LGTVNVFARELRLPLHSRGAWKVLVLGRERSVDLGRAEFSVGGQPQRRCFMQLAGAGLDSRAIELTEWRIKKRFGPLAYLYAGLKALCEKHPVISIGPDQTAAGELVVIGNGRYYGGPLPVFPRASLEDGLLDVCVLPRTNLPRLAAVLAGLAIGRMHQFCGARQFTASRLTLTSPARVLLQLDGENVGELPATLSVEPKSLRVIVP
jgi:diacylglycerol kinase family enzyme